MGEESMFCHSEGSEWRFSKPTHVNSSSFFTSTWHLVSRKNTWWFLVFSQSLVTLIPFVFLFPRVCYICCCPFHQGVVINSTGEILCLLSYTNSVGFCFWVICCFFFIFSPSPSFAHVLVGVWWCITVIALP